MDKEYILYQLRERLKELKHRYRCHVNGTDEFGTALTAGTAAVYRSNVKQQINLLMLVEELVIAQSGKMCYLTEEAIEGLDRLLEPVERHRRLK